MKIAKRQLKQIIKEELQNTLEGTEGDYRRSMGGYINTPDSPRAQPTGMSSDDKFDFMDSVNNQVKQKLKAFEAQWILEDDEAEAIGLAMSDMTFETKEEYVEGIKNALNSIPGWMGFSNLGDQIFNDAPYIQLEQIIKEEIEEVLSEAYSEERYDRGNLSNPLENPGVYYSQLKADSEDPSSYYGGEDNRPEGAKAVNQIAQLMHVLEWETGQAKKLPQLIAKVKSLIEQAKSMEGRPSKEADVAEQVLAQFLTDMPQF